ncbi:biotin--[acetyl-CoA-carboxylase] ligase [Nocardioides sp. MAH-18]|uniref:biotin--[biotin carboxyl-carrier protein] ligase n=1 Tax=Nocardioides agri TaxID=2682843 RepID=A0A6L6XNA6_9ACTN|nr:MULTISPECIES: biotin--[acetyl-CoA-carboxylase] ligase [unclassified Nocardioides]MBA2953929.1 biotin--[acetyl-CoA-carboxylase] ligase [Nocardioides sp. CGMCC 1.13656]MVQ48791.1 biotin--[acetyl-CoA-carboxylase] ligase [Nocardioides sp. MAH-18]
MRRPSLDAARLGALAPVLTVEVLEEATSTNAVAGDRARAGAPEGTVVVAEHQTAGRGRLDRTWQAPPRSSLTFSLVLRPTVPAVEWPWLPLLTGHVVARALRGAGYAAGVKWPNDVLIDDRKVAGILVERVETPAGPAAVVGVGLNVSLTAEELPVPSATSLAIEAGAEPDRTAVLALLLQALVEAYDAWQAGGAEARDHLAASYAAGCVTVGRDVRVELPGGDRLLGRATGVDRQGRLTVTGAAGETAVGAGDVVHVRSVT